MCCPICRKETTYQGNPYRPFCSERCRMLDLDNWLSGRYRIPVSQEREVRQIRTVPGDRPAETDEKADFD
jgi:endogenous inhibitor of DNA gyrase (YacG/DUF329 family)